MKVGQKVVCVYKGDWGCSYNEKCPIYHEIYTIREIVERKSGVGLLLVEIINQPNIYTNGTFEVMFDLRCFRPIDLTFGEEVSKKIEESFIPKYIEA